MNDDAMLYLEVGNGYKAGGFDEDNSLGREIEVTPSGELDDIAQFEDETVTTVEIGGKFTLADGRGRLNAAIFQSEYEDVQVSTFDGNAAFVVGNAAETEVRGVEADLMFAVNDALTVNAAVAYLDAEYKSFPNAACNVDQILAAAAATGSRACVQDLSGAQLQFAPEYTANIGLEYVVSLGSSMELTTNIDYNWSDDVIVGADQDVNLIQDSYGKLNARLALASLDSGWMLALVGKNLTDEKTFTWGNDVPLGAFGFDQTYFKHIDPPRTWELVARYNF